MDFKILSEILYDNDKINKSSNDDVVIEINDTNVFQNQIINPNLTDTYSNNKVPNTSPIPFFLSVNDKNSSDNTISPSSSISQTQLNFEKNNPTQDNNLSPVFNKSVWSNSTSEQYDILIDNDIDNDNDVKDPRVLEYQQKILKKYFKAMYKAVHIKKKLSQFITIPKFEKYKNAINKIEDKTEKQIVKSNHETLVEQIQEHINKLNQDYFVISVKYDKICLKYNNISLAIMILSALSTFVEALRLTITEYMKNNLDTLLIDIGTFTLTINVLMLITGTIVTILSSIIRFKNYREVMEKLKNIQNMIMKYIILYNKQIDIIHTFASKGIMDEEVFIEFTDKIKEYNKEINDNINILEDIRNSDVIKLQKYKHEFDIKIDEIQKVRELKLIKLQNMKDIEIAKLNKEKDIELFKIDNDKNKSLKDLDYIKEKYDKEKFVKVTALNNKININLEKKNTQFEHDLQEMITKEKTKDVSNNSNKI